MCSAYNKEPLAVEIRSEASPAVRESPGNQPSGPRSFAAAISRNIAASLARVLTVSVVAIILPAYLTHRLPVTTYAAWVLILQLAAYVSYLDLGVQTAVSKFVAEYEAKGDRTGAGRHASAGLVFMLLAGALGVLVTVVLAWQVPRLFRGMPANLYHDVRVSVILVGSSLAFGLVCAVYAAVFLGLQRYWIPMTIGIINRLSFAVIILAVVALHGKLEAMGIAVALVNVGTGLLQVVAWQRKASHIPVATALASMGILKTMARYCSLQSIWIFGMLCVAGLDVTIVGHYDYAQTAYYSIAVLPTSFVLLIISSLVNPLMPASSALSTQRSPVQMGEFLAKISRYGTLVLLLTGLPLMVCGFPFLRLWVGAAYAIHTIRYLRILVLANIIRNLCAPYATMMVATDNQGPATAASVCEAVVNLGSSIYLASRFGAIGVAIGTLIGSVVSVSLHFAISMHYSRRTLAISRPRLFLKGMLQPAIVAVPALLLLPLWWSSSHMSLSPGMTVLWAVSTLIFALAWGLNRQERSDLVRFARNPNWAIAEP